MTQKKTYNNRIANFIKSEIFALQAALPLHPDSVVYGTMPALHTHLMLSSPSSSCIQCPPVSTHFGCCNLHFSVSTKE